MDILIEVNGSIDVPDGVSRDAVADAFIDWIESNHWYFGGGFQNEGHITFGGCIDSDENLSQPAVEKRFPAWFASMGWRFEGTFQTRIETKDLVLRRAEFGDWRELYENVWRHEEVVRYMCWDVTDSEEAARDRIERTIRYQQNGGLSFVVTMGGQCIGFAGVTEVAPGVYEDTGIAIGPKFQRKGYGKQMLEALERFVFGRGGEVFRYTCFPENLPSRALALSQGFRYSHSNENVDFYEKRRNDMEVKITYHGHSCFTLEYQGVRAVIDPYAWGMIPGTADLHLQAEAVYCSHGHGDHNFTKAVELQDCPSLPWTVQEFTTPHDDCGGAKRGMNTVRIFDFGGIRVAHLGDIGCFPDEELAKALKEVDCLLIPVGGYYTIGCQTAYQIIRAANPRVAIPMHYRTDKSGLEEISHIDDFCKLWNEVETQDSPFVLTKDAEKQILILK